MQENNKENIFIKRNISKSKLSKSSLFLQFQQDAYAQNIISHDSQTLHSSKIAFGSSKERDKSKPKHIE